MNLQDGQLAYISHLFIAGYKLNNGNIQGLTNLQILAIITMKKIQRKEILGNKGFLVVD